jgi:hypothetical protein
MPRYALTPCPARAAFKTAAATFAANPSATNYVAMSSAAVALQEADYRRAEARSAAYRREREAAEAQARVGAALLEARARNA